MNGEEQFLSIRWHVYLRVREFLAVFRVPLITIFSVFTQGLCLKEKRSTWVKPINRELKSITLAQQVTLTSPKYILEEQLARRIMLASPADTRLKKAFSVDSTKIQYLFIRRSFLVILGRFSFPAVCFWTRGFFCVSIFHFYILWMHFLSIAIVTIIIVFIILILYFGVVFNIRQTNRKLLCNHRISTGYSIQFTHYTIV